MFHPQKFQDYLTRISSQRLPAEDALKRSIFKYGLWLMGIPAILYGATDRGMAAFKSQGIEITNVSYCLIALVILLAWICIGIDSDLAGSAGPNALLSQAKSQPDAPVCVAQQSVRLPFPYSCQIYHLLNLKHLEHVHRFSLGNLKVAGISSFHKTRAGGLLRFQTELHSSLNVLRLWRQPKVEVDLILHTPYQIELKIPAYGDNVICVLFTVIPLSTNEHQLTVQMFTNLNWPREFLRVLLLLASSITLLEDLPYLAKLAQRQAVSSKQALSKRPAAHDMQLFQRYLDLYSGR